MQEKGPGNIRGFKPLSSGGSDRVTQGESLIPSSLGSFPLSTCGRKEPGNTGGFKSLTSSSSDRAPPIRLLNEITWIHDSLKV